MLNNQISFTSKKAAYLVFSICVTSLAYLTFIIFSASESQLVFLNNYFFLIASTFTIIFIRCLAMIGLIAYGYSRIFKYSILILFLIIGVFLNISTFFYFTNDIFEFVGSDSLVYQELAEMLYSEPISSWPYLMSSYSRYSFSDFGYPMFIAFINLIYESVYAPRIINILMALLTYFYQRKTLNALGLSSSESSFFAALLITSPLYLFYVSSGLKEIVMTTIIVMGSYYTIASDVRAKWIPVLFAFTALMFFRIPAAIFFLASALWIPTQKKFGIFTSLSAMLLAGLVIVVMILQSSLLPLVNAYFFADNPNANIPIPLLLFSGFAGPIPNPTWSGLDHTSWMYASGLIERSALTIPFIVGALKCFSSKKLQQASGILIFVLLNIFGLIWAEQTLKARYIIPFLPAIYILVALGFRDMNLRLWLVFIIQLPLIVLVYLIWNGLLR